MSGAEIWEFYVQVIMGQPPQGHGRIPIAGGIVSVHLVAFNDLGEQEQSKEPSSL